MIELVKITRPCVMDIKEYVPGKPIEEVKRELGLEDVIKLSSNENPLGASPLAIQAMVKEIQENVHFYPEATSPLLAEKLARMYGLNPNQFLVNNGVDGVLAMIALAFINPGDAVVTSQFSFFSYQSVTAHMGGRLIQVPQTPDHRFDVDAISAALTPSTKIVFLCNPNNPTGTVTTRAEFERLLAAVPENCLLVSDEAYYDFVDDPEYPQTLPYLKSHPNLIITRTFSKVMGLAGVRIGYAIASEEIIQVLRKVCDPFPVNRAAQAGALAGMDDVEFLKQSVQMVQQGREQLRAGLIKLGVQPTPSQGNFIMIDFGFPARSIYEDMLSQGVIIRPLGPQGLPNCLRITVGTPAQNERALAALQKALQGKNPKGL